MESKANYITQEVAKFDVTESSIVELEQKYSILIIFDINDKDGYKKVKEAKKVVKKLRISVENKRKDLKKNILVLGKSIDTEASRIKDRLTPIEESLQIEMTKIDDEKEEIANRDRKLKEEKAQGRIDECLKYSSVLRYEIAMHYNDEEFSEHIAKIKSEYEDAQIIIAAQQKEADEKAAKDEADREAEKTRIKADQKKLDDDKAEFEAAKETLRLDNEAKDTAAQKIIDDAAEVTRLEKEEFEAEKKAFQDEKDKIAQGKIDAQKKIADDKQHAIDVENASKAAVKKANDDRIAEDNAEKERVRLADVETKRQDALRPDRYKILEFADSLLNLEMPEVSDSNAKLALLSAHNMLVTINRHLIKKCEEL